MKSILAFLFCFVLFGANQVFATSGDLGQTAADVEFTVSDFSTEAPAAILATPLIYRQSPEQPATVEICVVETLEQTVTVEIVVPPDLFTETVFGYQRTNSYTRITVSSLWMATATRYLAAGCESWNSLTHQTKPLSNNREGFFIYCPFLKIFCVPHLSHDFARRDAAIQPRSTGSR